jgi:hypothetical protein
MRGLTSTSAALPPEVLRRCVDVAHQPTLDLLGDPAGGARLAAVEEGFLAQVLVAVECAVDGGAGAPRDGGNLRRLLSSVEQQQDPGPESLTPVAANWFAPRTGDWTEIGRSRMRVSAVD